MVRLQNIYLIVAFCVLTAAAAPIANAAYFDIPTVYGADGVLGGTGANADSLPGAEHFQWLRYANGGAGYNYTANGGDLAFAIEVRLMAPQNWSSTYDSYKPSTLVASPGATFDNVYSYFYRATTDLGSLENLAQLSIPYNPATVNAVGYEDGSDADLSLSTIGGALDVRLLTEDALAYASLAPGSSSDWFYMTSENWWGWQPLSANFIHAADGSTSMYPGESSPNGMIPAPNPEAPVVALYLVGLGGVVVVFRHRRKGSEAA